MADKWVFALNVTMDRYQINAPLRMAAFLAQVGHESGSLAYTIENLNYGAPSLMAVFPKYFPTAVLANTYARQPEKIANRVYANRMGNGDEASGDGWRNRGMGLIQVTGKDNQTAFASSLNMTLDDAHEYLQTVEGAAMSAGWYWDTRHLNQYADQKDMMTITRRINGGTNGLDDRMARYERLCKVLGV